MRPFDSVITFCPTPDLARLAAWYERVLGLTLAVDQGSCRIYRVAGQGFLGFCERADATARDEIILTFVTDEVEQWYERFVAEGVVTDHPPRENPRYGIVHFFARDPDGRRIEIQRFLSSEARASCHEPPDR